VIPVFGANKRFIYYVMYCIRSVVALSQSVELVKREVSPWFDSVVGLLGRCCITTLGKMFTPHICVSLITSNTIWYCPTAVSKPRNDTGMSMAPVCRR